MAATKLESLADNENFANILFVPPQLSGRPQTPTASVAPRGNTPGGRISYRTPSRTSQPPPMNTALDSLLRSEASEKGQYEDGAPSVSGGFSMPGWNRHDENGGPDVEDGVLRGARPIEYADTWVTLFGFAPEDLPIVLREFLPCGDIMNYDTHEKCPIGNWVHVQFRNPEGAQRALLKNGTILNGKLIVGVQPLSLESRAYLESVQMKNHQEEEIKEESTYQGIMSSEQTLQTTGHPTPLSGPFGSEKRLSSNRRPSIPESDMPQPSWEWLRPIGVLFGF